jgi:hypothetical protein
MFLFAPLMILAIAVWGIFVLGALGIELNQWGIFFGTETGAPLNPSQTRNLQFGLFLAFLFYGYFCTLIWLFLFVRYSRGKVNEDGTLMLRPFIGKERHIRFEEITGFSECSMPRWFSIRWGGNGIVLYLKNTRHIQLNEKSLLPIEALIFHLEEKGVRCLGSERCWFYPFVKTKYKFDPK